VRTAIPGAMERRTFDRGRSEGRSASATIRFLSISVQRAGRRTWSANAWTKAFGFPTATCGERSTRESVRRSPPDFFVCSLSVFHHLEPSCLVSSSLRFSFFAHSSLELGRPRATIDASRDCATRARELDVVRRRRICFSIASPPSRDARCRRRSPARRRRRSSALDRCEPPRRAGRPRPRAGRRRRRLRRAEATLSSLVAVSSRSPSITATPNARING